MAIIDTSLSSDKSGKTVTSFPKNAKAITKSDDDVFSKPVTIFVGVGGTVTVVPVGGDATVQFTIQAGGFVPVLCTAVLSTGTSASGFVAVW